MADKKISQLTALSAANLAPSTDVLAIVDTSATETKKIVAQDLVNGVLNVASAVGIGTASPGAKLHVLGLNLINIFAGTNANSAYTEYRYNSTTVAGYIGNGSSILSGASDSDFMVRSEGALKLLTNGNNARVTIDTSGNLGIGTTSPSSFGLLAVVKDQTADTAIVVGNAGTSNAATTMSFALSEAGTKQGWFRRYRDGSANTEIGFSDALLFTGNVTGTKAERGRFTAGGSFVVGKTTIAFGGTEGFFAAYGDASDLGFATQSYQQTVGQINREGNDGELIIFYQAGTQEGDISVNGTTVSYNGGHLSRWSQTPDNTRIPLLKGTVMSNLDQMAVWEKDGQPLPNEQLNCMKVSDVEGDLNVAGVFVNWDNDDDVYTNDMNIAMTGDMIIRIAQGVVVQRGDLLMSAGDGTAKPQGDDIIRSKTIAKVISNHVTCTYEDGSYCVPCVLMAC